MCKAFLPMPTTKSRKGRDGPQTPRAISYAANGPSVHGCEKTSTAMTHI